MDRLEAWFAAGPHRATVANIVLLTVLLALIGSHALFALVGGIVVALAFLYYAWRALTATLRLRTAGRTYRLALLWVPGVVAVVLAGVAITVVKDSNAGSTLNFVAFALFAFEAVLLVVARPDRADEVAA